MKKLFQTSIAVLSLIFVLAACSSTKNTVSTNVSRGKFVGTWTLNNVSYQGIVQNAVQNVFDQAPPEAFTGSTWKLTNSGNGVYTLANGTSQTIFWSVNNTGPNGTQFQFKKLYEGDKAKNVQEGYVLEIASNDGSTMTLKSPVAIGGGTGYVIYSFAKAN
ncbi:hypothetical protein SAMN05216464_1111 [Mucilaginibacter pineti]|uniref:Lipocalin-like domain-containing protein n=1 Tax=Mucilaginibacter pineti TaxID=1391627 RepID=A0A1G7H0J9_9SPHI|nr:hypothetical protein [Mucilaginibacter pineti]SDE93937.1 hypothetical protein SAMN05216464_1111 [Mucilaginibacter pineti]